MGKPDDKIRCDRCECVLKYNKEGKIWDAVELYPESKKCWKAKLDRHDHTPRGNVGRLLRVLQAARRSW